MSEWFELTVNDRPETVAARAEETLLEVLRRELKLFSVREACGLGICGSCTVIVDGQQVSSCLMLVGQADGRSVETVDALAADGQLHPIQQAFIDHNAFQCSYCTPGFLLATRDLLACDPDPDMDAVRHFLAGNLCRCGSYVKILDAVLDAAARLRASGTVPASTEAGEPIIEAPHGAPGSGAALGGGLGTGTGPITGRATAGSDTAEPPG